MTWSTSVPKQSSVLSNSMLCSFGLVLLHMTNSEQEWSQGMREKKSMKCQNLKVMQF